MPPILSIETRSIFGFATTVDDKSNVPAGYIMGNILLEDLLHHTSFENQGKTELVVVSVPRFFLIPMNSRIITGNIRDNDVVSMFEDEFGDEGEYWIKSTVSSFQHEDDVNAIFDNIKGNETTYVSSSYDVSRWTTNPVTCSITPAEQLPPNVVQALSRNLGISSSSHTTGTPAGGLGQASLPPTVAIVDEKEQDKALVLLQTKLFYKALLLTGKCDFENGTISDVGIPYLANAFDNAFLVKNIELRSKTIKRLYHSFIDEDASDLTLSSSNHTDALDNAFLTLAYIPDPMARALACARFADTLMESDISDISSSKIDAYSFLGQLANSDLVKNARKTDADAEDELVHEQHENFMKKRKDKIDKLGNVEDTKSPISLAVNIRSLSNLAVSTTGNANQPIFYQVFTRVANIVQHKAVQTWAATHEKNQPQLPHLLSRWIEELFVGFVKAASALSVASAVEKGDASAVPIRYFTAIIRRLTTIEQKLQDNVSSNTYIREIPLTCPLAKNPDALKEKKRRLEMEHQLKVLVAAKAPKRSSHQGSPANGTPNEPADEPSLDTPATGSGGSDQQAGSNGGRGGAGRGGRGRGRGGGRGGRGGSSVYAGSNPNMGSIFVSQDFRGAILPTGLTKSVCINWICMGKSCRKGWGECNHQHVSLDRMNHDLDDKQKICDHVANTEGLWFNKASVKSLTEQPHKAKLGGPDGPGTD